MYFSSLSSPAPPAGRALHDRAAARDGARERGEVELELAAVGRERDELDVVPGRLAGSGPDQAVRAREPDRLEVADGKIDRWAAPVLPTGLTIAWS